MGRFATLFSPFRKMGGIWLFLQKAIEGGREANAHALQGARGLCVRAAYAEFSALALPSAWAMLGRGWARRAFAWETNSRFAAFFPYWHCHLSILKGLFRGLAPAWLL